MIKYYTLLFFPAKDELKVLLKKDIFVMLYHNLPKGFPCFSLFVYNIPFVISMFTFFSILRYIIFGLLNELNLCHDPYVFIRNNI